MANEFIARKGLIVSGSGQITGSLDVSAGITGSLFGTASWAENATSASAATSITFTPATASFAVTASYALTSPGGAGVSDFPYTGSAIISGSLQVTGSTTVRDNFTVNGSSFFVDATNNRVGIGTTTPSKALTVTGSANITGSLDVTSAFTAQTKSFKITHQRLSGKSLVYGVLEGPEHGVYARGRLKNSTIITLPEEWEWLVNMDSITVNLTSIGTHQKLYVDGIYGTRIVIGNKNFFATEIDCYYTVYATRKDVPPLKTVE